MFKDLRGNQKAIRIKKVPLKGERFTSFTYKSQLKAMAALRPNTYKLWTYLCSYSDGYDLGLSSTFVKQICHFSRSTYDNAVHELIDKGYLIKVDEIENGISGYYFLEEGTAAQVKEKIEF